MQPAEHLDVDGESNASSVFCNSQKLVNFTSISLVGSTKIMLGDLNPSGVAPLKDATALFILYKNRMTESDILLHHKCFCNNWYKINLYLLVYMRSFVFNTISKDLGNDQVDRIKKLFNFYHLLTVCYKWKYKILKKLLLFLIMVLISLTVVGSTLAPITQHTSLSMNSCGVLIKGYISKSNISKS